MSDVQWATFDCFGTLVDWRHGIATGAELICPGHGQELLELYNKHEPQVHRETPGMRYGDVLAEALRRAAREAGLDMPEDDSSVLAAGLPYWPVFPDVRRALADLRAAGWRLALLTNCDRVFIGESQRRLGVHIDAVVTAEDVGSYKPNLNHFRQFQESFGATRENWVHVAEGYFHDMEPAHEFGIPRVWINRQGLTDDPSITDAVLPDLTDVVRTVERVHNSAR